MPRVSPKSKKSKKNSPRKHRHSPSRNRSYAHVNKIGGQPKSEWEEMLKARPWYYHEIAQRFIENLQTSTNSFEKNSNKSDPKYVHGDLDYFHDIHYERPLLVDKLLPDVANKGLFSHNIIGYLKHFLNRNILNDPLMTIINDAIVYTREDMKNDKIKTNIGHDLADDVCKKIIQFIGPSLGIPNDAIETETLEESLRVCRQLREMNKLSIDISLRSDGHRNDPYWYENLPEKKGTPRKKSQNHRVKKTIEKKQSQSHV